MKCPECDGEMYRFDSEWGDIVYECYNCGYRIID